jgi:hypothetical protein
MRYLINYYKKAQISQAFVYIAAVLVIGAIIVLGFKGLGLIFKTNCEGQRLDFERDLESFLDEYSEYGTVQEKTLTLPCKAEKICFVDYEYVKNVGASLQNDQLDPVMLSNIHDGTGNVFIKGEFTEKISLSNKVAIDNDKVLCVNASYGKVRLVFSGTGKAALITPAE